VKGRQTRIEQLEDKVGLVIVRHAGHGNVGKRKL